MGTQKRERQKANRRQRQIEEAHTERVSSIRRNAVRIAVIAVVAIVGVVVIAWIGGAFDSDDEQADTAPTLPTAQADDTSELLDDATEVPDVPKPEVSIPDAVPDELSVTELEAGTGPGAAEGDTVSVFYVGVLSADGTEFDTNYGGAPFPVTLGEARVIAGWEEGLLGVQEGGRYQLDIPADLAYGDAGSGSVIGPGDALTFVIDVVAVTAG